MSPNDERASKADDQGRLVSIIVPFLNPGRFLNEAISSVLAQTYVHWELLLVNDGSTDTSPMFAEACAHDRPTQVLYLQHPDLSRHGTSTSRNLGISHSRGDYIAFLDADDIWFSNKLERQVALLEAEPEAAMVFGSSVSWHSWTGQAKDLMKDEFAPVLDEKEPDRFVDLPMLSVREVWHTPSPSGILVRRVAAAAVGNFESGFENIHEDQAFYFKLGLNAKILASHECWYKYRRHANSVCAIGVRTGAQIVAKINFLRWSAQYLSSSKIERPDLVEAISRELLATEAQGSRSPMPEEPTKRENRLRQIRSLGARSIIKKIPGIWSTWHLGHALHDAWVDSSERSKPEIRRDFNSTDPWNYNSNLLERTRHQREAEMLDRARSGKEFPAALEIGCAEGAFTSVLADRCGSLLATDFSEIALERARLRCRNREHIAFAHFDLRTDVLPGAFDLIVAIHVIEYIKNPLALRRIREKLVRGLNVGGFLLLGSCTGNNDFRESLWWSRYMLRGGRRINEFIAGHPALTPVEAEISPLPGSISRDILLRRRVSY